MSSTATIAATFKNNLYTATVALMAADPTTQDVMVTFGHPGTFEPLDLISFTKVTETQNPATISTNRTRNEVITQEVMISCMRPGGQEMEQICSDRAYTLLRMIEQQVRVTDTTVGGTVWWCFLASHSSNGETDITFLEQGRLIEITAVFEAHARITT